MGLTKMWHKPDNWHNQGPALNGWVQDLPTHTLRKLWDMMMDDVDADPGCFLCEAIQTEMRYRGYGDYVAL